jgi:plasmid stabilization system protein ParE
VSDRERIEAKIARKEAERAARKEAKKAAKAVRRGGASEQGRAEYEADQ